jgi:thymidylate synthase
MVNEIKVSGVLRNSRAGPVLEFPEPVATTYSNPTERVLFDLKRLCNPFFHFVESLWIIKGSRDVELLDYFNSLMKQYSDDGETFYGAYGYRLRTLQGFDQIEKAVHLLRANHDDRRVVLQMWDAKHDLGHNQKDHPCNTHIYLKIRKHELDMTVCCRSNDMLYGAYGANVVHMSMLQEYIASRVGVGVGIYTQVSDSAHVYTEVPVWEAVKETSYVPEDYYEAEYPELLVKPYPMFKDCHEKSWHADLDLFILDPCDTVEYKTPFFRDVAQPIALVWEAHKKNKDGLKHVHSIKASDWRFACKRWLELKEGVK